MKFLNNLDLSKNELQNMVLQNLAAEPAEAKAGQMFYDSVENLVKVYNGSAWVSVGSMYELPIASASRLGGIKVGNNLSIDPETGVMNATDTTYENATTTTPGLMSENDKIKLNSVAANAQVNVLETVKVNGNALSPDGNKAVNIDLTNKADLVGGKVPASQLPGYVDDVIDLLTLAGTAPASCVTGDKYYNTTSKKIFTATGTNTWGTTGETPDVGVIYVAVDTNKTYRWSGSDLVEISASEIHKFTGNITGNGSTKTFTINHGLGTQEVIVNVYEAASPYEVVFATIKIATANSITVDFAVAPATGTNYKVVVIA